MMYRPELELTKEHVLFIAGQGRYVSAVRKRGGKSSFTACELPVRRLLSSFIVSVKMLCAVIEDTGIIDGRVLLIGGRHSSTLCWW